jgi:hypothetical protein
MADSRSILFVCEAYYLRFYRSVADRLFRSGFKPIWIVVDGSAPWTYESIDPSSAIEKLAAKPEPALPDGQLDALYAFERGVFERPDLFKENYAYTLKTVRTVERARQLAAAWYQFTRALLLRFRPGAVFLWNGRYLPYSAVSAACAAAGQEFLTSEIGWVPGTIFVDRGTLSTNTTDLAGRRFGSTSSDDARADAFLADYTTRKATMVSQSLVPVSEVRQRLLGDGTFLLLYGCQVDWDTNVVIGARRFRTNESAVTFLIQCADAIPGARLVIKTHPLDSDKREDRLREIIGSRGTVVSDIHPHTLIEASDCVAVRNSTLGFEALCYGKPLVVLEDAKYAHPNLTLDARSVEEGSSSLLSVAQSDCNVPERALLRQFILHLLDHYLWPVRYEYFFEPAKLELLSHLAHNDSYQALEQLLERAIPPTLADVDGDVLLALDECELRRTGPALRRQVRKLTDWIR